LPYDNDKETLKQHLKQFLKNHNVEFESDGKFICPFHKSGTEKNASMGLVPNSGDTQAYCFTCKESGDIFKFAAHYYGLNEKSDFAEIKRRVAAEVGHIIIDAPIVKQKPDKPIEKPVTLSVEAARAVYTQKAITSLGEFTFGASMIPRAKLILQKAWPCLNSAGEVDFIEARFDPSCFTNGKKRPFAVWWNGSRLKSKSPPHALFGRNLLAQYPDKPVLIVEGPKCQEAAQALPGFVPVAWNGGAHGQRGVDFSPLQGRRVYIWPDDEEAGEKSARDTAKLLQDIAAEIIIIRPLPEARAIKPQGADIVEALQVKTPEELERYILNHTPPEELPKSNDPYIHAGLFQPVNIKNRGRMDGLSANKKVLWPK